MAHPEASDPLGADRPPRPRRGVSARAGRVMGRRGRASRPSRRRARRRSEGEIAGEGEVALAREHHGVAVPEQVVVAFGVLAAGL